MEEKDKEAAPEAEGSERRAAQERVGEAVAKEESRDARRVTDANDEGDPDADAGKRPAKTRGAELVSPKPSATKNAPKNPEARRRRIIAVVIYAVVVIVMAIVAGPERLRVHTPFNHYAQLADAWAHGRNDLGHDPPAYSQGNDFAHFEGKWYISFPPFPAMLMLPFVWLAGSAENFQDGQFVIWLSGIAPAVLFLVLEKLRRTGRSERSETENVVLALLFAFGSVYFFTAVQGTVWFCANMIGAALLTIYVLFALDAERPLLAGLAVGFLFLTRVHPVLASVLFGLEAIRVYCKDGLVTEGPLIDRVEQTWARVDKPAFYRAIALFSAPILACIGWASLYNHARFGTYSPTAFGHEHLTVVWHDRITKWGLAGYHYVPKNLGVWLTVLPWLPPGSAGPKATWLFVFAPAVLVRFLKVFGEGRTLEIVSWLTCVGPIAFFTLALLLSPPAVPPFQINEHGLALWFTTPLYVWLLWPKKKGYLHAVLWLAAVGSIVIDLMYQNSGWRQFGYRFSNDYAPLLFMLLAIGGRPMGWLFRTAAAWALAWNLFGAVSFDHGGFERYYWREPTQKILYQDD